MQCWLIKSYSFLDYLSPLLSTRTCAWYRLKPRHYIFSFLSLLVRCLRLGYSFGSATRVSTTVHQLWLAPFLNLLQGHRNITMNTLRHLWLDC